MRSDRRDFPRIPQSFDAQYRLLGALAETWKVVRTINLSATGMRFRSAQLLEPETPLEIQIKLPSMQQPLQLRGRVAWSQMQASGVVENGVEFVDLAEHQQVQIDELVQFLRRER